MSICYLVRSLVVCSKSLFLYFDVLNICHSFILPGPAVIGLGYSVVPADPLLKFNYVLCFFIIIISPAKPIK